jgi:hypothetical protein
MPLIKRFIFLMLALFFLSSLSKNILEYRKNIEFYNGYKNEYEEEKKKNNELKTLLVKTVDAHQMEKMIRNKLNLHKDNESIIIVPQITPTPTIIAPTPVPNYKQWADTFFQN